MAEAHNGYEAGHWLWFATASLAVPRMATFSMTAGAGSTIGQVVEASLWRPRLRRIQHLGGPQMGLWTGLHQDCRDVTPWLEAMGHCTERPMHQRPVCLITSTPQSFSMFNHWSGDLVCEIRLAYCQHQLPVLDIALDCHVAVNLCSVANANPSDGG